MEPLTRLQSSRGLAILAVVFFHVQMILQPIGLGHWRYWVVYTVLSPVLMPFFFVLLGSSFSRLRDGATSTFLTGRIISYTYLYLVWSVFELLLRSSEENLTVSDIAISLVLPTGYMWFLFATVAYVLFAMTTAKAGASIQIGAALGIAFFGETNHITENLVFFLIGYHYRNALPTLFSSSRFGLMTLTIAFAVALLATAALGITRVPGVREVVSLVGVVWLVQLGRQLDGTFAGPALSWLGNRTLPIYLLHLPVIRGIDWLILPGAGEYSVYKAVFYPPLIGVLAVVGSALVCALLKNVPGLFGPPVSLLKALRPRRAVAALPSA